MRVRRVGHVTTVPLGFEESVEPGGAQFVVGVPERRRADVARSDAIRDAGAAFACGHGRRDAALTTGETTNDVPAAEGVRRVKATRVSR